MNHLEIINRVNIARSALYGSVLGEIGHEINNHLNSISLSSQIIELYAQTQKEEEIINKLQIIDDNLESVQAFTKKMVGLKEMLTTDILKKENWDMVGPGQILKDIMDSFGKINRFDKVQVDYDDILPEYSILTNYFVMDFIILALLMNTSLQLQKGRLIFSGEIQGEVKILKMSILSDGDTINYDDMLFESDFLIRDRGLFISFHLINDVLNLLNATMVYSKGENDISNIGLIYS